MNFSQTIWRFNPSRTSPQILEQVLVQRSLLANLVFERIRDSGLSGQRHHQLLIGPSGIGKTHLVAVLRNRVANDRILRESLRVVWLNDLASCSSFLDLLLRIMSQLTTDASPEFSLESREALYDLPAAEAEAATAQVLLKHLTDHPLLLIVENLDELFDALGDEGQKRWRSFLQQTPVITILATATQIFSSVQIRSSPFFGFFQIEYLKPLTVLEASELLGRLADLRGDTSLRNLMQTTDGRALVQAVYHLAGGNHRVYVILSEIRGLELIPAFRLAIESVLDVLTPLIQSRLRSLSLQQRRIVEFLCASAAPTPVKEIARRLFISEQTAASQLKTLKEHRLIVSHVRGRESLYELTDPLMRLVYARHEHPSSSSLLIVDFLRNWYQVDEGLSHSITTDGSIDGERTPLDVPQTTVSVDTCTFSEDKSDGTLSHTGALWGLGLWDQGFESLEQVFAQSRNIAQLSWMPRLVISIASSSTDPESWRIRVARLMSLAAKYDAMGILGVALVRSLSILNFRMLSHAALDAWSETWCQLGQSDPQLLISLRLFRTGIQYLKSNADRKVLLGLFEAERRILESLFTVPPVC